MDAIELLGNTTNIPRKGNLLQTYNIFILSLALNTLLHKFRIFVKVSNKSKK